MVANNKTEEMNTKNKVASALDEIPNIHEKLRKDLSGQAKNIFIGNNIRAQIKK